jgi:hypothetical protein
VHPPSVDGPSALSSTVIDWKGDDRVQGKKKRRNDEKVEESEGDEF